MIDYLLFELASGYALFEHQQSEQIGQTTAQVQQSVQDLALFGKHIKLKSFLSFKNAHDALEQINQVSEGVCSDSLKEWLEMNITDRKSTMLGVGEKMFAGAIKAETGIQCQSDEHVHELLRGVRLHITKLIKQLEGGGLEKTQLGLGHAYSRSKVKFNVNRSDNMITQAICMLDQLDKDINTFSMRIREWYSWHFPELVKLVPDNHLYARMCQQIKNKSHLTDANLEGMAAIVGDEIAVRVLEAARLSMGTDISEIDMINIDLFATRVIALQEYRVELQEYLHSKMNHVAPNLAALIGDTVGARLISHAGSLTNLSKYPASTVQILGAEKALFRALKTRGNTPKYGLIYHSSFIGRAGAKNKGRVSRYLANKCSIASRIDCFSDVPTTKFGEAMKQQVEDRLSFYESGAKVAKNETVMQAVIDSLDLAVSDVEDVEMPVAAIQPVEESSKKDKKKRKLAEADAVAEESLTKQSKKEKKRKHEVVENATEPTEKVSKKEKKDKKKSKKHSVTEVSA